jgi:hypothetical protein
VREPHLDFERDHVFLPLRSKLLHLMMVMVQEAGCPASIRMNPYCPRYQEQAAGERENENLPTAAVKRKAAGRKKRKHVGLCMHAA